MRRPLGAGKALGLSPMAEARWAHSSRVERVPSMAAGAKPEVVLSRRPVAERAADTRAGGVAAVVKGRVAVDYWSDGGHDEYYEAAQLWSLSISRRDYSDTIPLVQPKSQDGGVYGESSR